MGASSYLATPNGLGPWAYANLNPLSFADADGRRVPDNCDAYSGQEYERCKLRVTSLDLGAAGRVLYGESTPTWFKLWMGASIGGSAALPLALVCSAATPVCVALGWVAVGGTGTSSAPTTRAVGRQIGSCVGREANAFDCSLSVSMSVPGVTAGSVAVAEALARTQLARALTFSAYLELAPLELEAPEVAAMRAFQSGAPQMSRLGPASGYTTLGFLTPLITCVERSSRHGRTSFDSAEA